MLDIDIIGRFFAKLSGVDKLTDWTDLLRLCKREVESMVKHQSLVEPNMSGLCYAAAALAYYRFCLKSSAGVSSFKAGDVSIAMDDTVTAAKNIYTDALSSVAGVLKNKDFAFICV